MLLVGRSGTGGGGEGSRKWSSCSPATGTLQLHTVCNSTPFRHVQVDGGSGSGRVTAGSSKLPLAKRQEALQNAATAPFKQVQLLGGGWAFA